MKLGDHDIKGIIRNSLGLTYGDTLAIVRQQGSCGSDRFRKLYYETLAEDRGVGDLEVVAENVRLAMQKQKLADKNRIENKAFREDARLSNAMEECGKRIIAILGEYDFSKITIQHATNGEECIGIVQLSDLHFNELVATQMNHYDFEVAAKRMKKYATRATEYLKFKRVKSVLVASTGDILNSDRRLDEYMNQSTNRMNAAMLAVFLIEQFLIELNRSFNVTFVQVSGNESRVKDEPGNTDNILTDNYDALIYNVLKHGLKTAQGITFLDGDIAEKVVNVMGKNVLITHGEQISSGNPIGDVQKIKGKYAQYGVAIDFVVFGHVHTALVHDHFARGASMVGANAYTDRGLQLTTRASQNIHLFYSDGSHDSLVIDLQNTDGIEGYEIKPMLVAYNAKSEKKLHNQTVIHEIVI